MAQDSLLKNRRMKKSTSYDQDKIKVICDQLCERIEDLLEHFDLEYRLNNRYITMSCPIHGGDNDGALNLYHVGDSYRGNWKCRTHKCEEIFKPSIIGFIRGIISHRDHKWEKNGDDSCSFQEAIDYATNFLNVSFKDIKISNSTKEKNVFINASKVLSQKTNNAPNGVSRATVRKNLSIPSKYFLSRGFEESILNKYDVGDCLNSTKEMNNRAVVPVYDNDHELMIGCTGRSIFNKCDKCNTYHDGECLNDENSWKNSKWRHSYGFKTQQCLYNFWYAKEYIAKTNQAILVESPGNVWRLEEFGIHNSLALFGSNITDMQKTILDMSGAMDLVIIMDNDEAGEKASKQIYDKCYRTYNIKTIKITKNDIAEMNEQEIEKEIKRYL